MSGRKSRNKGQRREREFAKIIQGERIPLVGRRVVDSGMMWKD